MYALIYIFNKYHTAQSKLKLIISLPLRITTLQILELYDTFPLNPKIQYFTQKMTFLIPHMSYLRLYLIHIARASFIQEDIFKNQTSNQGQIQVIIITLYKVSSLQNHHPKLLFFSFSPSRKHISLLWRKWDLPTTLISSPIPEFMEILTHNIKL